MKSNPEPPIPRARILARAIVYALAVALLVLYAPSETHVFIYQGF